MSQGGGRGHQGDDIVEGPGVLCRLDGSLVSERDVFGEVVAFRSRPLGSRSSPGRLQLEEVG